MYALYHNIKKSFEECNMFPGQCSEFSSNVTFLDFKQTNKCDRKRSFRGCRKCELEIHIKMMLVKNILIDKLKKTTEKQERQRRT